ncbi:hypothetical protein EG329_008773 [Mollisiaceae sp. DMI_Dod_QoI]|nr:hypothetical protein EG329_008773 [Helotiales sp. DMI_Dod_QoI]
MSFGWSVGDIAECVKLFIKIGHALKDSNGSIAEYQRSQFPDLSLPRTQAREAVEFLKDVETTVQKVEAAFQDHPEFKHGPAFEDSARNLSAAVIRFRRKIEGYDKSLGINATDSGRKKALTKIKLALFVDIEELKGSVAHSQVVLNSLMALQVLDTLVDLSNKPTLSAQQLQDSTKEILGNFPPVLSAIEDFRFDITEEFSTIQQTTDSHMQKLHQILLNLPDQNALQSSISEQAQADAEAQELWRNKFQISIAKIEADVQQYEELLQEMRQAQEVHHQQNMQTTLQAFSWRNAFRPAAPRPAVRRHVTALLEEGTLEAEILKEEGVLEETRMLGEEELLEEARNLEARKILEEGVILEIKVLREVFLGEKAQEVDPRGVVVVLQEAIPEAIKTQEEIP